MRKEKLITIAIIATLMSATLAVSVQAIGESPQNPIQIPTGGGTYTGHLPNGTYNDVWYNVTAYLGHVINATLLVPADADFDMLLYGPNYKTISKNPTGCNENITYTADWEGNWSIQILRCSGQGDYTLIVDPTNYAPAKPAAPLGNSTAYVYMSFSYTSSTIDLESDNINYTFYWGDGTSTTVGPYSSGQNTTASHQWTRPKIFNVQVRAKDRPGNWSDYSDITPVNVTQNDANSGRDAGNNQATAVDVCSNGLTYYGTMYKSDPLDTLDFYNFTAQQSQYITAYMAPPSGSDFDLKLFDPNGSLRATSRNNGSVYELISSFPCDQTGIWSISVEWISGDGGRYCFYVSAYWGGGGCPYFYIYDGQKYVNEGLLDIHNADGIDVIRDHYLVTTPKAVRCTYQLRLIEHHQTISSIDQVKFYAMLEDKTLIQLPLIWARHSENGNVLPQLLFSDDWKTTTLGADHNNGVSQSINLKFLALPKGFKVAGFLFVIEGNNQLIKELY